MASAFSTRPSRTPTNAIEPVRRLADTLSRPERDVVPTSRRRCPRRLLLPGHAVKVTGW